MTAEPAASKVHKVEVLGAVEDGALVVIQTGLGLPVVSVLQGTQVVGGGLDLGVAHAVPDEQEDVFRGLDGRRPQWQSRAAVCGS